MEKIALPDALTERVAQARRQARQIGFVPTMGALHQGHLDLVRKAREHNGFVVCSIFVNPLQFNDPKDLERYPRDIEKDARLLEAAGCDVLFNPEKEQIFSDFQPVTYDLGGLDTHWEGPSRPGHFQGVVNVVERLFFYVRPDRAYFGEKDRQQLAIIQYVGASLRWPEKIIPCPTTREADGLAMSSRNLRLNADERRAALWLYRSLAHAREKAFKEPWGHISEEVRTMIGAIPGVELDYFGFADPRTLRPLHDTEGVDMAIALIAARVGPVRLIDNITLSRP